MFQNVQGSGGSTPELTGILKGGKTAKPKVYHKAAKFNELNILETFHPANKDYGHMVIDEPQTPYVRNTEDETTLGLDPKELLEKLRLASDAEMPAFGIDYNSDDTSDEDFPESIEERARRIVFERKRKAHYKEFQSVPLARRLIIEEFGDMSMSASELSVSEEIPTASIEEYQQEDQTANPSYLSSDTDDEEFLAILEGKKKSSYIEVEPGTQPSHPCYQKLKAEIPAPAQPTYSLVTPPSTGSSASVVGGAQNTSKYAFENIIRKTETSRLTKRSALKKSKASTEETTAAKK